MKIGMKFRVYFLLLFLPVALVIAATAHTATAYTIETVKTAKKPIYERIPAEVISSKAVMVSSKIPGFIHGLKVDIGDRVKKGETLLFIEKKTMQQNIKQAKENVAKAKANLENAQFNYSKFLKLYKQKVISKQQFLNMKTNFEMAKSAYQQALSALAVAESNLKYSIIKSPVNGVISEKFVNNGDMAVMFQPLLKISTPNNLQVKAGISEQLVEKLKRSGCTVVVGKTSFRANSISISPAADPVTRTFTLKITIPETVKAKPGEFACVVIKSEEKETILIERSALTSRGGIDGVFVVDKNNRAHFRMVKLGETYGKQIEVLSGLFPGERIVVNPPLSLANRSNVTDETQK